MRNRNYKTAIYENVDYTERARVYKKLIYGEGFKLEEISITRNSNGKLTIIACKEF